MYRIAKSMLFGTSKVFNKPVVIVRSGRMIKTIKDESICDRVHIIAIGREAVVPEILPAAGL